MASPPPPPPSRNELFERALGKGFEEEVSSSLYSRGVPHVNQPQLPMPNGATRRPDTVTLGAGRLRPFGLPYLVPETVEEQKDVRTLRPEHIEQAYGYGQAVQPRSGTNVNVPARTEVPLSTLGLASLFGVGVRRWPY
jgi:hypothetical protein